MMKHARRNIGTTLLAVLAVLVLLTGAGRGDHISDLRLTTGPYEEDLLQWHLANFMDKWVHLALRPIQGTPTEQERLRAITEFFELGDQLRAKRRHMERTLALSAQEQAVSPEVIQERIDNLQAHRASLQPVVLEAMEAAISQALEEKGIFDRIGPVRWPPVNFTFSPSNHVLVRSPRDEILRLQDLLLRSDVTLLQQIELEDTIEADGETAALVVRVGGLATYPAQVTPDARLETALFLAAHEWLHHWMFFRPLGKRWWDGGELTSINETVADMVGEEIGDRAYEILTGLRVERPPWQPPAPRPIDEPPPDVFDFTREMRQTRVELEALLAEGKVDEAEAYLEERRQEFVANGWNIRKLNTAWFAFYGTYGRSPGAISPIETQLRFIRADSGSLMEFLDRVGVITQPGELEGMAREAGWRPLGEDPDA